MLPVNALPVQAWPNTVFPVTVMGHVNEAIIPPRHVLSRKILTKFWPYIKEFNLKKRHAKSSGNPYFAPVARESANGKVTYLATACARDRTCSFS